MGITLPILTQHKAAVAVENATLSALKGARTATASRVAGDVLAAAVTAEARRAQLVEYRDDIVPRALAVERMAEDWYRLGQTPLIALLTALQATRDVRLRSLDAAADSRMRSATSNAQSERRSMTARVVVLGVMALSTIVSGCQRSVP